MEKLKSFLVSLILIIPFIGFSQEQCGTDEMIRRNPFLQQLYGERVACAPEVDLDTAQVLTIPVVFHILHLGEAVGEGTNISDEQVLSCIENLNHRFRGDVEALAALTDEYDEYELSLVKDAKIEFCMAARGPDNTPTDGINRYDCSDLTYDGESYALDGISNGSGFNSGVSDSYIKNLFHWPVDKYFNCYVVSEINGNDGGNGIQGYSYLGSSGLGINGYIYGPVCLYNVTGTTGTLKWSRELNSTWTHEIGHALDLFHTFSNAGSDPCSETNGCTQGDQVPDTPPTNANNVGCVTGDCPDAMLENYMDYTPEWCKTAFTQGQIERMRDEIYTGLPYLISADNVSCQSPNSKDVGITSVSVPSNWCLETLDFNVKINNFGEESAENVTLLVNGNPYEVPTIDPSGFVLISVTDFVIGNGVIECEVIYDLDEFLGNNTFTQSVEILEQNWLEVSIRPDVWSNEIDWEITDENGEVVLYDGDWPVQQFETIFTKSTCLPDGCYTFTITDSNGDGLCSFDFGNDGICDLFGDSTPFINIFSNDELIFELSDPADLDYGSELIFEFCVIYCPPSTSCKGDFDGDGLVTVRDLMNLLSTPQGTLTECSDYDLNNDLQINLNDILDFLSVMGTDCFTGDIFNVGMIPLDLQFKIRDLTDVSHVILDKQVISTKYYTLRGERLSFTRFVGSGVYLKETLYTDGTKEITKIFISE
jgi:hypothetical protein